MPIDEAYRVEDNEKNLQSPLQKEQERQIVRKLDKHLLPLLGILYLFSYLDRVNIGNARLYGLEEAIHLSHGQYNIVLAVFFLSYFLFELPSNIILLRVGARRWIPILMVIWGTVSLCMAFVVNFQGLIAARFVLGMAEAGFVPGVLYYLTLFYKRSEISFRMAIFLCFNILAGSTGGLLAAAIANMNGVLGLQAWQWVFIIEAAPTLFLALITWLLLPPSPADARFLTAEERKLATDRILYDCDIQTTHHISWRQVKGALVDVRIWILCFSAIANHTVSASVVLFLPSLIKDLGFTAVRAQLLTAPPYAVAACFALIAPWWSDRLRSRGVFVSYPPLMSAVGFLIMAFAEPVGVRYFAVFMILSGILAPIGVAPSWITDNSVGHAKRASALAMYIGMSGFGSMCGTQVYRNWDAPRYRVGHLINVGAACICSFSALLLRFLLARENSRRDKNSSMGPTSNHPLSESDLDSLGDKHPDFRYTL